MPQLKNNKIKLEIFGVEVFTITEPYMSYDYTKDLSEEPNTCEIIIHTIKKDLRDQIKQSADYEAPVKLYITPAGSQDLVLAFSGELMNIESHPMKPGYETTLYLSAQKANHRDLFLEKTYAADTPIADIVNDFIKAINLPLGNEPDLPPGNIIISETFSGPAFTLLREYVENFGDYCYILDGKLYITSVYEPPNGVVIDIIDDYLWETPEQTSRIAQNQMQLKTIAEAAYSSPFEPKRKKRKKKKKKKKISGIAGIAANTLFSESYAAVSVTGALAGQTINTGDYVEYEAVDNNVDGMTFSIAARPDINPDIILRYKDILYRTQNVNGFGDNFGGDWDTDVEADVYTPTDGDDLSL